MKHQRTVHENGNPLLGRKNNTFWDVTSLSLVEDRPRFGGTYCLHLQGRRVSNNRQEMGAERSFMELKILLISHWSLT
jgi:hypothetical protein